MLSEKSDIETNESSKQTRIAVFKHSESFYPSKGLQGHGKGSDAIPRIMSLSGATWAAN